MATAKLQNKTRPDIVLTLSYDEAVSLWAVMGVVWGDEVKTRRRYTDAIYYALEGLGLDRKVVIMGSVGFCED